MLIDEALLAELDADDEVRHAGRSEVIRRAVRDYLGGGALRDDQHARALLSADERGEVVRHRSTVVRHQYSSLIGGPFEHIQVMKGLEPRLQRRSKIQARLASPQTGNDILVEVLVGLEANPQDFVGSRLRALLSFS